MYDYTKYIPKEIAELGTSQEIIPNIAKNIELTRKIEESVKRIKTKHRLYNDDSREIDSIPDSSVHLILTSPPYWNLKKYNENERQLGHIDDYFLFINELEKIWKKCLAILVPGGRLVCVVGDVCLSRRKNNGEHTVYPLHASIQKGCMNLGFNNLAPIIWNKIANAKYEVAGNTRFLGKPYEPNGVIKNDIEYILMERKPGGYRKAAWENRVLSIISDEDHKKWFNQIWTDVNGESTKNHPAPFPLKLAERLIRMYSFVGDIVVDPFMGTGTTNLAALKWGRNSIGIEVDEQYYKKAKYRLDEEANDLFSTSEIKAVV